MSSSLSWICTSNFRNPNDGPMTVPVEWPQFDPETNVRLVESPEPFVENIPEDLMEDLTFWNHFYDIMIPRDDSGEHFLTSRNFYLYYRNLKSNHQYSKIHPRICYKYGERGLSHICRTNTQEESTIPFAKF